MKVSDVIEIYEQMKKLLDHPRFEKLRNDPAFMDAMLEYESERLVLQNKNLDKNRELNFDEEMDLLDPLKNPIEELLQCDVSDDVKADYELFSQGLQRFSRKYMVPSTLIPEEKEEKYMDLKNYLLDNLSSVSGLNPEKIKKEDQKTYMQDMKKLRDFLENDPKMNNYFHLQASVHDEKGLNYKADGKDRRELLESFGAAINGRLHEVRAESFNRVVSDTTMVRIHSNNGQQIASRQYSTKLIEKENRNLSYFSKALKGAKTFKNSDDYTYLMNMVNDFSKRTKFPQAKNLSMEDAQVLKYALIKKQIDQYISHKGKSGVKPNALNKLAAVEELNRYVSEKLQYYQGKEFHLGKDLSIKVEKVSVSYAGEKMQNPNVDAPTPLKHSEVKALSSDATTADPTMNPKKLGLINDCMSRIILDASKNGRSMETIRSLKEVRNQTLKPLEKGAAKVEKNNGMKL